MAKIPTVVFFFILQCLSFSGASDDFWKYRMHIHNGSQSITNIPLVAEDDNYPSTSTIWIQAQHDKTEASIPFLYHNQTDYMVKNENRVAAAPGNILVRPDCLTKITVVQPINGNMCKLSISGCNNPPKTTNLSNKKLTYIAFQSKKDVSIFNFDPSAVCNAVKGDSGHQVNNKCNPSRNRGTPSPTDTTPQSHEDKCPTNTTLTLVPWILLALSVVVILILLITIYRLRNDGSRADKETGAGPANEMENQAYYGEYTDPGQGKGLSSTHRPTSTHDSENSLYGAVVRHG